MRCLNITHLLRSHCLQSYPLDLVRTRLTAQTTDHYYQGIYSTVRTIIRDEGMRGLYRGLGATLGQVTPALAVNYAAYESLRAYFMATHPEQGSPSVSPLPPICQRAIQVRICFTQQLLQVRDRQVSVSTYLQRCLPNTKHNSVHVS